MYHHSDGVRMMRLYRASHDKQEKSTTTHKKASNFIIITHQDESEYGMKYV